MSYDPLAIQIIKSIDENVALRARIAELEVELAERTRVAKSLLTELAQRTRVVAQLEAERDLWRSSSSALDGLVKKNYEEIRSLHARIAQESGK